jgi:tRNA(fMet)-specific endonuclease VapC
VTAQVEAVLLDTDVLSFFFNQDQVRVRRYEAHLHGKALYVSFVSVEEVRFGALIRGWGPARMARLEAFLEFYRVVESTPEVGVIWAGIRAHARRVGRPIERQDAWIAAIAVASDIPLLTRNAAHFADVPLLRIVTEPDR